MAIISVVEKTITAENQFTDWIFIDKNDRFTLNIKGTFDATVTLQKSYDAGVTIWDDEVDFNSYSNETGKPQGQSAHFRVGVKTGNFTSGTVDVRMGRG